MNANQILQAGVDVLERRGKQRDSAEGERSMAKTIEMFNTLTGHNLTETEGWQLMAILKMVRHSQGEFQPDDLFDGTCYMALALESAHHEHPPLPEHMPNVQSMENGNG